MGIITHIDSLLSKAFVHSFEHKRSDKSSFVKNSQRKLKRVVQIHPALFLPSHTFPFSVWSGCAWLTHFSMIQEALVVWSTLTPHASSTYPLLQLLQNEILGKCMPHFELVTAFSTVENGYVLLNGFHLNKKVTVSPLTSVSISLF